jgi:hypothetical protein
MINVTDIQGGLSLLFNLKPYKNYDTSTKINCNAGAILIIQDIRKIYY